MRRGFAFIFPLCIVTIGLILDSRVSAAQETDVRPKLSATIEKQGPATGQDYLISVDFLLPDGMHQFRQDDYFYLRLAKENPGVTSGDLVYPPTNAEITGLPAWSGSVRLQLPIHITPGVAAQNIAVEAAWQVCYDSGICLRPATTLLHVPIPQAGSQIDIMSLWYLLLAFVGGIILNLMPCVLPVLALKTMALLRHSDGNARLRLRHGLASVAGIIASMMVLAGLIVGMQAGGRVAGWGFQFQSPWYTIVLSIVILAFALSLWGVWTIRAPVFRVKGYAGQLRNASAGPSLTGSFLNGVLTVVLATPCTAPFLGTALGFAFSAPPLMVFLVLLACGAGLALPFFLLAVSPGALRFLPKPGKWMDRLSEILGFALLATFVWLVSILFHQVSTNAFVTFLWISLLLAALLRIFGWLQQSGLKRPWSWMLGMGLLLAGAVGSYVLTQQVLNETLKPGATRNSTTNINLPEPWRVFEEDTITQELKRGKSVFVDFTAEWCLTCKVNESGALADRAVLSGFKLAGVELFRGDYTNGDPIIDRWLAHYGRAGVPFYVFLRPNGSYVVLPELLDVGTLLRLTQVTPD